MVRKQGFTLIELVVVIVVIGIIGITAMPKFVGLSSDARIASLHGIEAALETTSVIVELKAKIEDIDTGKIYISGEKVKVNHGYLEGRWNNGWGNAIELGKEMSFTDVDATCTLNEICAVGSQKDVDSLPEDIITTGEPGLVMFWLAGAKISDRCYAFYYNPYNGDKPTIGIVDDGC